MTEILVSKTDFDLYKPIPQSLRDVDFAPYILKAQRGWVRDVLGSALYRDVHSNKSEANNQSLLNGGATTDSSGNTVDFFGLKPAIVNYAYAIYLNQADLKPTRSGNKRQKSNNSDQASSGMIAKESAKAMQDAQGFMFDVIRYLYDNRSLYPLFKGLAVAKPRGSIRVGRCLKTDYYSENDWQKGYNELDQKFRYGY